MRCSIVTLVAIVVRCFKIDIVLSSFLSLTDTKTLFVSERENSGSGSGRYDSRGDEESTGRRTTRPTKPNRDLRKLLEDLEESDYGAYGSWGNFRSRNRNWNGGKYPQRQDMDVRGLASEGGERVEDDEARRRGQDPAKYQALQVHRSQSEAGKYVNDIYSVSSKVAASDVYQYALQRDQTLLRKGWQIQRTISKYDVSRLVSLKSSLKLLLLVFASYVLSYMSVSPQGLPSLEHNAKHHQTFLRLGYSLAGPLTFMCLIFHCPEVDINEVVDSFTSSVVIYYPVVCVVQFMVATLVRLSILRITEPGAFQLCPDVPSIFLPWLLPKHGYFARRSTLFFFSLIELSLVSPIVEEYARLLLLRGSLKKRSGRRASTRQRPDHRQEHGHGHGHRHRQQQHEHEQEQQQKSIDSRPLSRARDFAHQVLLRLKLKGRASGERKEASFAPFRGDVMDELLSSIRNETSTQEKYSASQGAIQSDCNPVRQHLIKMMSITLGLKLANNFRRILLYNKDGQRHKSFFAVSRGFYPVPELCGVMTALAVAREHLLQRDNRDEEGDPEADSPSSKLQTDANYPASYPSPPNEGPRKSQMQTDGRMEIPRDSCGHLWLVCSELLKRLLSQTLSALKYVYLALFATPGRCSSLSLISSAVILHCAASFRGMKPLYLWNSDRPWDDVQLQAWGATDDASALHLFGKAGMNLLWFLVLFRTAVNVLHQYMNLAK